METREIKDINGDIVITISLPEGTSEEQWQQVISAFVVIEPTE